MNTLFVHDHQFLFNNSQVYSDKLPYEVWERYLRNFDKIEVWGRGKVSNQSIVNLPLSSGKNVEFHYGDNISGLHSFLGTRKREYDRLYTLIVEADSVIARLPSEYGLMAASIADSMGKPYAIEVVGCAWDALWNYGTFKAKLYAPVLYRRMQKAVQKASNVVYVSKYFLQERYPANDNAYTDNISNVEIESVSELVLQQRLQKIEASQLPIRFGTIGSLKTRYKGVHTAIQALGELSAEIGEFEYRVLGAGDTSYYKKLAKEYEIDDKVFFDGTLPSGEPVFNWLDSIDMYMHPSFQEGLPRAVIEAMSRGCPVIASSTGGIPELIDDQWIHKAGDISQMKRLIHKLTSNNKNKTNQASLNFKKAKSYQSNILSKKRDKFLINLKTKIHS